MNDRKCGLIVKIEIHNLINEWDILSKTNSHMSYQLILSAYRQLVKHSKKSCTPCVHTALDLPYRHLQPNSKGLLHALHATVLILDDTALKGMTVYE